MNHLCDMSESLNVSKFASQRKTSRARLFIFLWLKACSLYYSSPHMTSFISLLSNDMIYTFLKRKTFCCLLLMLINHSQPPNPSSFHVKSEWIRTWANLHKSLKGWPRSRESWFEISLTYPLTMSGALCKSQLWCDDFWSLFLFFLAFN